MVRRRLAATLLGIFTACAGRPPQPTPALLELHAPEPRVRVGLLTRARVVRLSSSAPFLLGIGDGWTETRDVLVELDAGTLVEGSIYRVQIASFLEEAQAASYRDRLQEELQMPLTVSREMETGRFAVRAGELATEGGARALLDDLARRGLEGLRTAREPVHQPKPRGLTLLARGQAPMRTDALSIVAVPGAPGGWVEVDGSPYRGYVDVRANASHLLTVTNVVHLEDYLRGVVPAELSPSVFPEKEALKAQAIAARTYVVKRAGQFDAEGYDICATPACQVYRGVSVEQRLSDEAVRETAGEALAYEGELVDALYTSTCGGRTENAENVFSTAEPYLVSRACFTERGRTVLESGGSPPLTLRAAALSALGIVSGVDGADGPIARGAARAWLAATLEHLGQDACWSAGRAGDGQEALDAAGFAALLGEGLCWERRLPYLVSSLDAERIADGSDLPEATRRSLAYAVQRGLIVPPAAGLGPETKLTREAVLETLYRLVTERGPAFLREGRFVETTAEGLRLRDAWLPEEESEIVVPVSPALRLYRSAGGETHFAPRLTVLPSDRLRYRRGERGIDLLVVDTDGGSFDRTSRFSHWVVRKSNEELSREVNLRHPVGVVRELRPKRYGRSGRLAELEVVGSEATATLTGLSIRRALGIRENLFFFDALRDRSGAVRAWVFSGRGWGHGVGMCQVGAYGMAAAGFGYREILEHYYPGTRVVPLEPGRTSQAR